ncbi:hypothetical protein [Desulfogranum mediterraneum]|uniref:hypothetical protein n=1 Tax=Desulfogranum mediterraneum TaxID=160661 RepID=UPI0004018667|nr:hypothetical protein [Desulfogranum mediterraneum]
MQKKNLTLIYNLLFLAVCGGIFLFLYLAPPETTAPLPHDDDHRAFLTMKKKVAERQCEQCHAQDGEMPLPADHPPKYRCLFCHKQK